MIREFLKCFACKKSFREPVEGMLLDQDATRIKKTTTSFKDTSENKRCVFTLNNSITRQNLVVLFLHIYTTVKSDYNKDSLYFLTVCSVCDFLHFTCETITTNMLHVKS